MAFTIRVAGATEAAQTLRGLPERLERTTLLRMSQIAYDAALRGADRHTKTGALRQSLYNRAIPNGREVGHDPQRAPHALFVNFGTRPHVIRPKDKKALRWVAGNGFVFAKKVNHPGYRGDAYIVQAATEAVREFARIVGDAIKEQ